MTRILLRTLIVVIVTRVIVGGAMAIGSSPVATAQNQAQSRQGAVLGAKRAVTLEGA